MIILDMNQISLANLMMNFHMNKSTELEEDMVRHMILNSIRMYRHEYKHEYGEVVLTWDSKHSWRRDYFPEYKASRRKGRQQSDLDWDNIFGVLNKIRDEIKDTHTPNETNQPNTTICIFCQKNLKSPSLTHSLKP